MRPEVDRVRPEFKDPAPLSTHLFASDREQAGGDAGRKKRAMVLTHGPFLPARHGTAALS
jgi:hypothetical protein